MSSAELKQNLFTEFRLDPQPLLSSGSRIFFIGSCFSENIGHRVSDLGFSCFINPAGILFDPLSVQRCLEYTQTLRQHSRNNLYFSNGAFHSLDHHGSYQSADPDELLNRINERYNTAHQFLRTAHAAIITPGTAWCYYHLISQAFVANCHRIPQSEFTKNLLSEDQIIQSLNLSAAYLRKINPEIRIIFTISPVKHLRDGVMENALSKARLLSAIQQFAGNGTHKDTHYFPAFEIMTEELRDHRFYAADKAHPSDWSIEYIFRRFSENCFDDRGKDYINKAGKYLQMLQHRMISADGQQQAAWKHKLAEYYNSLMSEFPESQISAPAE